VSAIENNIEELGQSVKFNEKLKKIWLEHVRPPWHQQKKKIYGLLV
jgi:hypothetical protein